jgi:hypothetical protein
MLNRPLCLVICIIGTMPLATSVLAQCKLVDPHNRKGYYDWCECMGGVPTERNGNSVCDMPSNRGPNPPNPVIGLAQQYRSRRSQIMENLTYRRDRSGDRLAKHFSRIIDNFPEERSIDSLDDAYFAADELASYLQDYLNAYKGYEARLQKIRNQTRFENKLARQMNADLLGLRSDSLRLKTERSSLEARVELRNKQIQRLLNFVNRFDTERKKTGARVLRRINAPFSSWYTSSTKSETEWLGGIVYYEVSKIRSCCDSLIPPSGTRSIEVPYWNDPFCDVKQTCHKEPPLMLSDFPVPPSDYSRPEVQVTGEMVTNRINEIDASGLMGHLLLYPVFNPLSARETLSEAHQAWKDVLSIGPKYWDLKQQNEGDRIWTENARKVIPDADHAISVMHDFALRGLTKTAFWWELDHLTQDLVAKAGSNDPEAISRLRKVENEVIKFSKGEFALTQQSVRALVEGNPAELQRIQDLMNEKLCDFKTNVDAEVFPMSKDISFLFPSNPSCGN